MFQGPAGVRCAVRDEPARRASVLLTLPVLVATWACSPNTEQARPYPERIAQHRAEKDAYLGSAPDSPIAADARARWLPLAYFPVDQAYVAPAQIVPAAREAPFETPTSTGQRRLMRRAGTLQFSVKGRPYSLTALVEADAPDMNRLFVPFGDMTNGTETYAAGRYLDLQRTATGLYELDFNLAYQPYCYYNPTYDCPYPPPENRLQVPIRAGERMRGAR
jgi:uncharacterized protein (DUF1684 family)